MSIESALEALGLEIKVELQQIKSDALQSEVRQHKAIQVVLTLMTAGFERRELTDEENALLQSVKPDE